MNELDRLRAAVLGDAALQHALAAHEAVPDFVACALAESYKRGIAVAGEDLTAALRDDPLGTSRYFPAPLTGPPLPGWLPAAIAAGHDGQPTLDWAHFGERPLRAPFFESDLLRALQRPINRLARYRTRLNDLPAQMPARRTDGFIFHISRCGSTLIAQMLAADPRIAVLSEPDPLDALIRIAHAMPLDHPAPPQFLRAMISTFAQDRGQHHTVFKFNCWHTLALPLFRRAFPDVPWVVVVRDPAEVLASQIRAPGAETMPENIPPPVFGLPMEAAQPHEDYCARVIARICEAASEQPGGLVVDYRELPGAVENRILPHFGIRDGNHGAMSTAARRDAKQPDAVFAGEPEDKRRLTEALRPLAQSVIGGAYARLSGR